MSVIRPFDPRANYTRFHNYLLDTIMPDLRPNSWKVLCYIVRKTTGWNKDAEQLSYSQLRQGTGIKSDPTLSDAIRELVDRGYVVVQKDTWEANTYNLNTTIEITVSSAIETTVDPTIETIDTKRKDLNKDKDIIAQKPTALDEPHSLTLFPLESKPKKISKTKKEDSPEEKERKARTAAILSAYVDVRGKNGINYAIEGTFAKKIDKDGYNSTQVKGCYLWMKSKPFWEDQPVTLSVIFRNMPEYVAWLEKNLPEASNGNKREVEVLDVNWGDI